MLRLILVAALITLPSISIAQAPSVIETANRATRQIGIPYEEESGQHGVQYCTSVLIGITRLLTAEHCVNNDGAILLGDNPLHLRLVKKSEWLALLEIEPQPGPLMPIAKKEARIGEEVASIGWVDAGGTKLVLKRNVAGYSPHAPFFFLDGPIVQGMSGGPVINILGELVGINQVTNDRTGGITSVKDIRDFIK